MRGDGWGDDWSVSTLIDCVVALAVTFAIARYGLGALFGMLPWLLVRDRARRWPWGAFSIAALALGLAIALGVADLGELSHALCAAAVQAFVWVHASGRAGWFWGGLMLVGLVCAVASLVAAVAATSLDLRGGAESWWQEWHWWALATVGCRAIWIVVRFPSREPSRQDPWPASHSTGAVLQTAEVAQRLAAGREGEARVRALFLTELPAGTWVLNNLVVPGLMGDIDLLVVGANGVFLPEIKTWAGTITCASDGRSSSPPVRYRSSARWLPTLDWSVHATGVGPRTRSRETLSGALRDAQEHDALRRGQASKATQSCRVHRSKQARHRRLTSPWSWSTWPNHRTISSPTIQASPQSFSSGSHPPAYSALSAPPLLTYR